jgi:hypothetical protein
LKGLRRGWAALAVAVALPAAGQVAPATDYTDLWWTPAESGWGLSIRQKLPANAPAGTADALFVLWYTYDPRSTDPASAGNAGQAPLWFVMPGGTWVSPTTYEGKVYVTTGTSYDLSWDPARHAVKPVGDFRLQFMDAGHGVFTYSVAAVDGLPAMAGTKSIVRTSF